MASTSTLMSNFRSIQASRFSGVTAPDWTNSRISNSPTLQFTKSPILKGFAAALAQDRDLVRFGIAEPLARAVGPPHADVADHGLLPESDMDARIVACQVAVRGPDVPPDRP